MNRGHLLAGAAVAAAAVLVAPAAGADVGACLKAAERAQPLRAEGKLLEARAQLIVCAALPCPAVVRQDCARWLSDTEDALPSVILQARGASGEDLVDVAVLMDGAPLRSALDGAALSVDPGERRFRFESPGRLPVEQTILVRQGERRRLVAVTMLKPGEPVTPSRPVETAVPAPVIVAVSPRSPAPVASTERSGVPAASWLLGGAALVLGGAGASLWIVGKGEHGDLEETCAGAGTCRREDIDASRTKLIAGDVLIGAAVLALGGGIVVGLLSGPRRVDVTLGPRGIGAGATF